MADRPRFGPAGTPLAFKKLKSPIEDVCMHESPVLTFNLADRKFPKRREIHI